MKAEGYRGIILHCNLDSHNKPDHAPCSRTLTHNELGNEHTLLCLKMWAVVGGTTDDKKEHKAQWEHVLKVYKERSATLRMSSRGGLGRFRRFGRTARSDHNAFLALLKQFSSVWQRI